MTTSKCILMTTDTVGGVWTYALDLSRALMPFNVNVALATMGQPLSKAQQRAVQALPNVDVFESAFQLEWMDDPWDDMAAASEWLLRIKDCVRPDVVHLNNYVHGSLPWGVPTVVTGHSCVFSWWQSVHNDLPPASWNRYRAEVTKGLRGASAVVAPSQWMLDQLTQLYGPFESSRVIPNGRLAREFHAGSKWPMVLCAGRLWDQGKNVGALAEIADGVTWPIYLAGEERFGPLRHPVSRELRYLGHLAPEEVARWMAQSSIFAMPARYEPFGLTVLEAALSGCALVLGDIPSLRENWDGAAVFVDPDDHAGLQTAIRNLAEHPEQLRTLAGLAQARAQAFSIEKMALKYLELYRTLCESLSSTIR
jgi:glycogen synthase